MSDKYHIETLKECDYEHWDRFVDRSPQGSVYSTSYFLQALTAASGSCFEIVIIRKGEEIVAGVGLHYTSSLFGYIVERRGLLFYNGPVFRAQPSKYPSKTAAQRTNITRALIDVLEDERFAAVSLSMPAPVPDTRAFTWAGWDVYPQYTYLVPITDIDAQWRRVEQNARRLITRCEREGMYVEAHDDFDCFYDMHAMTYRRLGLEPYFPRETFRKLYTTLRDRGVAALFFAMMPDGKPVSAQIVLATEHPVTHTWVAGADRDYAHTGISALLRWEVFKIYSQRGYAYNDLTDAMNESVGRFKSQFGGDLVYCPIVSQVNSRMMKVQDRLKSTVGALLRRGFNGAEPGEEHEG